MAKAFKCDLLGSMSEGEGKPHVDVKLDATRMLRVSIFVKETPSCQVQGVLSDDAAKKIEAALQAAKLVK